MKDSGEFKVSLSLVSGQDDLPARQLTLSSTQPVAIGRSSKATIKQLLPDVNNGYVNNPVISRNHATLKAVAYPGASEYVVQVEDGGSMHGTYINGTRAITRVGSPIFTDDLVRFGADVTRGKELFKAPEFRVTIEKLQGSVPSLSQLGTISTSGASNPQWPLTKDGFYVPDSDVESVSDSSPALSVINVDDDSDVEGDDDDSRSSASVIECGSSQIGSVPNIVKQSAVDDVYIAQNIISVDDMLSDGSDAEEENLRASTTFDDRHPSENEEDDSDDDEFNNVDDPADVDESVQSSGDESIDEDLFRVVSVEGQFSPVLPTAPLDGESFGHPQGLPTQSPFQVCRVLDVQDLDHGSTIVKIASTASQAELESLQPRQSKDSGPSVPAFFNLTPLRDVSDDYFGVSSIVYSEDLPSTAAVSDPFKYPLQPHGTLASSEDAESSSMSSLPHVEVSAHDGSKLHAANNRRRSIVSAEEVSSFAKETSRKRSFDTFNKDIIDQDLSEHMSLASPSADLSSSTDVALPSNTAQATTALAEPAVTSVNSTVLESGSAETANHAAPQDHQLGIPHTEPPQKRARLQSVAKTAGTVLASAVAGGVATFYALGLTPESMFT